MPLDIATLHKKLLNRGLSDRAIHIAIEHPLGPFCPKCAKRLKVNLREGAWAGCPCCMVEYAVGTDGTIYSRYEPAGKPHCRHYEDSGTAKL